MTTTRWFRKAHECPRQIWRWPRIAAVLPAALLVLVSGGAREAFALSGNEIANREFSITVGGNTLYALYESDFDITGSYTWVRHVVIAIHGSSRTAVAYHDKAMTGTVMAGERPVALATNCQLWRPRPRG